MPMPDLPCRRRFAVAALLLAVAAPAAASDWRFHAGAGVAAPLEGRHAAVGSLGVERDWRDFSRGRLAVDATVFGVGARAHDAVGLDRDVQTLAVGLRWRHGGWLLGFAPALATARTEAVSGSLQFVSTLGWQWSCCALLLQHISNAGTNGRNLGETMLMLEAHFGGR
jgi:hypothetical protein